MAASDYDELLTPYQRIREANQLGDRALAAQTAFDATRAVNPLVRERELAPPGAAAVPVEGTAVVAPPPQPNPFIRPSVPLSTMPLAQQLAGLRLDRLRPGGTPHVRIPTDRKPP